MMKMTILALAALTAAPASALDFDRGLDLSAFTAAAREALPMDAASLPTPSLAPSDARRDELIRRSAEWTARKGGMQTALDHFYRAITAERGDNSAWYDWSRKVWKLANEVEAAHGWVADRFLERIDAEVSGQAEHDRRWNAVLALRDFRRFALYGDLIPRVIDEAAKDRSGNAVGRYYAGPTWSAAMSAGEASAIDAELLAKTGFSPAEYEAMQKRANDVLNRP